MSRHVDKRTIQGVRELLKSLEPAEGTHLSAREAIREIEPDIREAMKKGYTLEAIHARIKKDIPISKDTLKGYLYGKDAVNKPASARRSA